jgi:hypothetical protein
VSCLWSKQWCAVARCRLSGPFPFSSYPSTLLIIHTLQPTSATSLSILLCTRSSRLKSIDTPAHAYDTGSHGHPASHPGESSLDRLDPGASSIGHVRSAIGSNGSRDDGPIDGSLVLLVIDDRSFRYSDGGFGRGTVYQSTLPPDDAFSTYAVLVAVQAAETQFPSPGSYQSINQYTAEACLER